MAAEDEMVGWYYRLSGHEFEQTLGDSERQGSLVSCSQWCCRVRHNLVTELQYVILHLKNTLLQNIFTRISLSLSLLEKLYIKTTMASLHFDNGLEYQH